MYEPFVKNLIIVILLLCIFLLISWACSAVCNTLRQILHKIAVVMFPDDSVRDICKQICCIVLLLTMFGGCLWFLREEIGMSRETFSTFMLIWASMSFAFMFLAKFLPNGIYKRICVWIFITVMFLPPLYICFRILRKENSSRNLWRHISRGLSTAGTAGAAAAKKGKKQDSKSKKQSVDKKNS